MPSQCLMYQSLTRDLWGSGYSADFQPHGIHHTHAQARISKGVCDLSIQLDRLQSQCLTLPSPSPTFSLSPDPFLLTSNPGWTQPLLSHCLSRCCVAVKRQHNKGNYYKRKPCLLFQRINPLSSWSVDREEKPRSCSEVAWHCNEGQVQAAALALLGLGYMAFSTSFPFSGSLFLHS